MTFPELAADRQRADVPLPSRQGDPSAVLRLTRQIRRDATEANPDRFTRMCRTKRLLSEVGGKRMLARREFTPVPAHRIIIPNRRQALSAQTDSASVRAEFAWVGPG
jgi:hypothetical protein